MSAHLVKDNPTGLKLGDKLLLIKSSNGIPKNKEGEIIVVRLPPSPKAKTISVSTESGQNYTLYYSGSGGMADIFRLVTRKEEATYLRSKIDGLRIEIKDMTQRAFELEEFETEEEHVAYKLSKILEAGSNPKAIAEILKTMKESNLL